MRAHVESGTLNGTEALVADGDKLAVSGGDVLDGALGRDVPRSRELNRQGN